MPKTITMCTRVEGHGSLRVGLARNKITGVYFQIQAFRGFENILQNKKLFDVPRIVSRVCGLCYASHAITACKAFENMFKIEPCEQSIQLRRLLMTGELINSHSMHFFFQALPDLFVLLKKHANPLSLSELFHFDTQITSNMFELIKKSKVLVTIFGGRSTHPITPTIGGILNAPSKKSLGTARKLLQRALGNIKVVTERFQQHFGDETPPSELELTKPVFMTLQNKGQYSRYDGTLQLKQANTVLADFPVDDYSKHFDLRDDIPGAVSGIYSVKDNQKLFVGPLSRYSIIDNYGIGEVNPYMEHFGEEWRRNLLYSNYLRLIEIMVEIYEGLAILENTKLTKPIEIPTFKINSKSEGIGVVEAPRGTLIHHYQINEREEIKKVKLLVATEINIPTINDILTQQSIRFYEDVEDLEEVKKYAQMILRTFDPCISCATH